MNFKKYNIGNLIISPNIEGYKTNKENFIFIENSIDECNYISIKKSELDDVINALIEIRDFVKKD